MSRFAHDAEGLFRHFDNALTPKQPPTSAAMRWMNQHRLSRLEHRLVCVVIAETLARRRGCYPISQRQLAEGAGLVWPSRFSAQKLYPALARLQAAGILRSEPGAGSSHPLGGRPVKVWWLGLVDEVLLTDSGRVLLTDSDEVLLTKTGSPFPKNPKNPYDSGETNDLDDIPF